MLVDMHIHTWYSRDSGNNPKLVLKIMDKRNIDAVVVANHGTTRGWEEFPKERVIPGIEFSTYNGHLLGLWVEDFTQREIFSFEEALDVIREFGGLAIIAHPFDITRGWDFKGKPDYYLEQVDGIEVCNSKDKFPFSGRKAVTLAREYSLIRTAGSDAHFPEEVGKAYVSSEAGDLEEFRRHLEQGEIEVHCGYHNLVENAYTYSLSLLQSGFGLFGRPDDFSRL